MKRLVLHIGAAKTGTSLLQTNLARETFFLEEHGFVYPNCKGVNDSAKGRVTTGNGAFLAKWLNENTPVPHYPENWCPSEIFSDGRGRDIVISSEFLMGFKLDRMFDFIEIARGSAYKLEIIVYFRSVLGHSLSSYAQHVKRAHYYKDFEFFLENDYKNVFWPLAKKLIKVSHLIQIKPFNYDLHKEYLVKHFLSALLGASIDCSNQEVINRSLTYVELISLRLLNELTKDDDRGKRLTADVSDRLIEKYPANKSVDSISSEAVKILRCKYEDSISRLNDFLPDSEEVKVIDELININSEAKHISSETREVINIFTNTIGVLLNIET